MVKVQTSVNDAPTRGRVGDVANMKPKFATTNSAEEVMKAGIFVKLGTTTPQIKKLAVTGDVAIGKLWGVTLHDRTRPTPALGIDNSGGEGVRDYAIYEDVPVIKEGSVYMSPEDAMTPSSDIYIRHEGRAQVQTIVMSAALVTGDVVTGEVGGVAIAPVTYATSNAATMTALAAAIELAGTNVSAVSNGTDTITVTTLLDSSDEDLTSWLVTSGGSGTAVATATETASSVHTDNIGRIRSDSDSSTATVAPANTVRVLESIAGDGIGPVSINLN